LELTNRVFRRRGGDMGVEFGYFLRRDNAPHLRVCLEDGRVVSHCGWRPYEALVMGSRIGIGAIGAVCTDPQFAGRGLASSLLADSLSDMRSSGVDLAMISGGRGLYRRAGAVSPGTHRQAVFDVARAAQWECGTVKTRPAGPADAARLAAIYRREPVRFIRPPAEWADIIAGRWCMNRPARLFCIARGDEVVAYAAVRQPDPKDAAGGGTLLGEFAGCRHSLAAALPLLAAGHTGSPLAVPVAPWDAPLLAELAARDLPAGPVQGNECTLIIVNFQQLAGRLRHLLVERAGPRAAEIGFAESGGRVLIQLDAERLELAAPDACRVFFGTPGNEETRLLEGRGELGRLLLAALPVSIPWYGYSFV
jgi:predicted N-acetyltransferase YhbS